MTYKHMAFDGDPRTMNGVTRYAAPDEDGCMVYFDPDSTHGKYVAKADWACWVDGYPVTAHLQEYVEMLRKKGNRRFKFVPFQCKIVDMPGTVAGQKVFQELWVYVDTCDFMLGKVGYGNYAVPIRGRWGREEENTDAKPRYMVYSRKIQNKSVLDRHDQYNMIQSEKLDRIVGRAGAYLRPYTITEYAERGIEKFGNDVREFKNNVINEASSLLSKCTYTSVVETELRNLIKLGVQFVTPEFREAAAKYLELDAEAQGEKMRRVGAYYVRVYPSHVDHNVMRATVLTYNQDPSKYSMQSPADESDLLVDDLPGDIQTKLSMLSMVGPGTYIPRVGRKVASNRFWVERDL